MKNHKIKCIAPLLNINFHQDVPTPIILSDEVSIISPCTISLGEIYEGRSIYSEVDDLRYRPFGLCCDLPIETENEKYFITDTAHELIALALLSLWISTPNDGYYTHAFSYDEDPDNPYGITTYHERKHAHEKHLHSQLSVEATENAKVIFSSICSMDEEKNNIVRSLTYLTTALHIRFPEARFIMFSVVLESLFSTDNQELSHKLSERIAKFLTSNTSDQKVIFHQMKKLYNLRSKIAHGADQSMTDSNKDLGGELEEFTQKCLNKIICNQSLVEIFSSNQRKGFLEDLIF